MGMTTKDIVQNKLRSATTVTWLFGIGVFCNLYVASVAAWHGDALRVIIFGTFFCLCAFSLKSAMYEKQVWQTAKLILEQEELGGPFE